MLTIAVAVFELCRESKHQKEIDQSINQSINQSSSVEDSCFPPHTPPTNCQRLCSGADRQDTIPSREQASAGRGSRTKGSHGPSLTYNIAKWTKKVSGFACGATLDATRSPAEERAQPFSSSMAIDKKPSRTASTSGSSYKSNTSHKQKKASPEDYDHHTLATAATASATISYSTDQGDDASEMGMEVIMSNSSHDQIGVEPYTSHSFPAGKHTFVVDKRYTMIRTIGSGAYGVVISANDTKAQSNVAVKMVPKAFSDEIDAKRILREIKLLKHFEHENIIGLLDMMPPNVKYAEDFKDVYLVTDLMETDLHRIIYSKQKLSVDHAQYFIYQVLRGLKYIHSCHVLHRDLKPSNLLVNSNCDLKICDFGLARGLHKGPSDPSSLGSSDSGTLLLTEYVVTRWYRAPEIMLACHEYSYKIDVWSVGCILAELILRKPYFPGDDYIDQLTIITQKLGKLSDADLDFVTSEKAKRFMKKLPNKAPTPLAQQFPGAPTKALDCMRKMLEIHPDKRLSVEEAIKHPFFESLHNPKDEPVSSRPFDFSFEDEKLHRVRLQELIWAEVGDFRQAALPVAPRRDSKKKE